MDKAILYNLIVNNLKLEELEARIRRFNPFRVLRIERHEIRHSNVLAWLLHPNESHNLGDRVFKKLVSHVLLNNEDIAPHDVDISRVQLNSFYDLAMLREQNEIDILAVSHHQKFVLLIENKILSKESPRQLKKYLDTVNRDYPMYTILPILLSLSGVAPEHDDRYCILDYPALIDVIEQTVCLYRDYLPTSIQDFITFYLESLRGTIEMDDTTKRLCKEIYEQHKQALDLIYEVAFSGETAFSEAGDEFLKSHSNAIPTIRKPNVLWMTLNEFSGAKKMSHGWNGGFPVAVWFANYYGNLKIIIEVGPFDDPGKRLAFIKHLEQHGFKVGEWAKRLDSKYTRLFTKYKKVNDWDDKEELVSLMNSLYEDLKPHVTKASSAICTFEW